MLQDGHHHTTTKEIRNPMSQWLLAHSTHSLFDKMLWETAQGSHNVQTSLPTLDLYQFAHHPNCSTKDAISSALQLSLAHLEEKKNTQMLLLDFSSASNMFIPQHIVDKLGSLDRANLCVTGYWRSLLTDPSQWGLEAAAPAPSVWTQVCLMAEFTASHPSPRRLCQG